MTEATMSGQELRDALLATIRRYTRKGTGIRTTECASNGTLVSLAHGLDPYNGGGCYAPHGTVEAIIREALESGALHAYSEASRNTYCWLVPPDMTAYLGSHLVRIYRVWDLGFARSFELTQPTARKLSAAQERFMARIAAHGYSVPPTGSRESGRLASAWHRTARSLADRGLIVIERVGNGYRAVSQVK